MRRALRDAAAYLDERNELRFRGNKIICDFIEKGLIDSQQDRLGRFRSRRAHAVAQLVAYSLQATLNSAT